MDWLLSSQMECFLITSVLLSMISQRSFRHFSDHIQQFFAVFWCHLTPRDISFRFFSNFFAGALEISWLASFDWPQPDLRRFFLIFANISYPVLLGSLVLACPVLADLSCVLKWSNKFLASNNFRPGSAWPHSPFAPVQEGHGHAAEEWSFSP